ncbi:lactase/phlorizin hydrolase [Bicyclus anynana]|uniref:beta-glucosidase n=1 Tax=Bicyclus anynana TaxID=110368 RepID=A0ABM3M6L3_BICAN|nr:lactase/phlorizin hydrolase [Bicyclus anynana]
MSLNRAIFTTFCHIVLISQCSTQPRQVRKFPKEFIFGTATSSYQIEGAWKADGKSENIWDRMTHTRPELIRDGTNGDIADNSYYLYKRDVEMLRELGADFYRFSLSWARILPTSFPDKINKAGVAYYNNLINELLKYNIQPMVTIYHWDLPQKLQELGGWANPNIVDWYADYARTVFTLFGDRVKYWITINEPHLVCHYSYGDTFLAPALDIKGVPEYLCAKNLLVAHATAYHIYDKEFRSKQQGKIFISFSAQWYEPLTKRDTKAADEANQFEWAQYSHPIYSKTGDFPPAMKRRIAARSAEQGFPRSRLPEFTQDEIKLIRGSSDIFGLNHYFTNYVNRNESVYRYYESPSFQDDLAVFYSVLPEWTIGESNYTKFVPWGFYKLLTQIRKDYGNPPIFITENGFATRGGLNDDDRVLYYTEYMSAMLDAMEEGSDVRAYTPWSLMDNYEWSSGYIEKFGLYEVDYSSPQLTRTPRKSAYLMKEIFRTHALRRCNNTQLYGLLLFLAWVAFADCKSSVNRHEIRKIPDGIMFGTATASYQVEGAWNEDGKSENIWDRLSHSEPCAIKNCDTGDIADDSYHQYERDVEMMRELGLDFYRFSLSWSRILPTSFPDKINEKGVQYYNNLIDEMLKYNIQPMVTLYHWDLPQKLQDMGGWTNPHVVDWFTDYARIVFELFGDRVKYWFTFNEPKEVCYQGYGGASMAPLYNISGYADYLCAKNLLISHAKTYHMYKNEFYESQSGTVGIAISASWAEPESEAHAEAAEDARQFEHGLYINPIFSKDGDFPAVMRERIAAKSFEQGFFRSRLPEFSPEEVELIKGSSDFLGINHYSSSIVYRNASLTSSSFPSPSFYDDVGTLSYHDSTWEGAASSWLKVVPWGFYKLLTKLRTDYNNPPIYITENGFSTRGGLDDDSRISYYRQYIDAMLDAVDEGSDVRTYTAWSLMDNFEWLQGYTERFGLYEVDYEDPKRTRTARKSAYVYKEIIRSRQLDYHYEPDTTLPITIDEGH